MQFGHRVALGAGQVAGQGLGLPLAGVYGPGLGLALVDGEHDAAVQQLGVDVDGGGGEHDGDGAGHPVGVGDQAT